MYNRLARTFLFFSCCCVPLSYAQEQISAAFVDGMTDASVDGYPGRGGNGWGGGWLLSTKHRGEVAGNPCVRIESDNVFGGPQGGNYLWVQTLCEGDQGGRVVSLAREIVNYDGVELNQPHSVRFSFRLDDASALENRATAYRFVSSDRPHSPNAADHRWWVSAFNLGGVINWTVRDGVDEGGEIKIRTVDTGIAVEPGVIYHFELFIDPANHHYVLRLTDDRGNRFQSEELGFRSKSGSGGRFLTFHEQKSDAALSQPSAFSLGAIGVSPGIPDGLIASGVEAATASPQPKTESFEGWPDQVTKIEYISSADGSLQPALGWIAESTEPKPLLVALHSWNGNYLQRSNAWFARQCIERGWHFIHPDFRGANTRPEAMGSELVVADIVDAVQHMVDSGAVDPSRIYLVGASGGGHAALLLAGRAPELWAGVSAWVPITDLVAWYHESIKMNNTRYANNIRIASGGVPLPGSDAQQQALGRSPVTWINNAADVALDINTGIHDGHRGSVPVSHALNLYNLLAEPEDRIGTDEIAWMTRTASVPESLQHLAVDDPSYGSRSVLLRSTSGKARLTVFDGGHEIVRPAALTWLEQQQR